MSKKVKRIKFRNVLRLAGASLSRYNGADLNIANVSGRCIHFSHLHKSVATFDMRIKNELQSSRLGFRKLLQSSLDNNSPLARLVVRL